MQQAWRGFPMREVETGLRRPDGTPRFANRLVLADSPYLRLHAFNPVDWRPWGDAAFAEAKRLRRPVFLSIGYATCHWCHVMATESFEDEEIARLLNERYVAIKVDREELPDVDATYIAALSALGSDGGWPANLWLAADRTPFYGGTYFAPRDGVRGQGTGLLTLLRQLADSYAAHPEQAAASGATVRAMLAARPAADATPFDGSRAVEAAVADALQRFDAEHGGQRGAPKFPSDLPLRLLLRRVARDPRSTALAAVTATLRGMARGALQDQVGSGFHRYTIDDAWRRPHFEKTLYDNALLATVYLEAFQLTGGGEFSEVAGHTLDALLRDFATADGGFASASDADSAVAPGGAKEEGFFFTWTRADFEAALAGLPSPRGLDLAGGSSPDSRQPLILARAPEDSAARHRLADERARLWRIRQGRAKPALDEKEVTSWNGLAIGALAQASWILDEPRFAAPARRAADLLLRQRDAEGRLPRCVVNGRRGPPAVLDDYAALIGGLLDLYEATGEVRWFSEARSLTSTMVDRFADPAGGFFFTAAGEPSVLERRSLWADGAEPAGNSLAALALLRLAAFTGEDAYRVRAERALRAPGASVATATGERGILLLAADWLLQPAREIVLVVPHERAEAAPFLAVLRATLLPARVLSVHVDADVQTVGKKVALVAGKRAPGGRPTAYVCRGLVCERPTQDPLEFKRQLTH